MAPSDETPQEPSQTPDSPPEAQPASEPLSMKAEGRRFPAFDGPFWKNWKTPAALAAVVALALGFGGGYVTANGLSGKPLFGGDGGGSVAEKQEIKGAPWWQFGKPRSADAPRAGIPRPDGFAVWKTRLDTSKSEPLACIEMTKPLDPSKAYADFVLISPDTGGTPAVSVNRSNKAELCIGGLGLTERRVTLLKGLPGAGGQTLAANADVDFTFGEKPPYVGFAGDGVILPREDSDGIGIETVNVSRLAIEVWRVSDRNLVRKSVSAPDPTGEGQWPGDYGDDSPDDEGRVVWKGEVAVRGEQGERATTVFPLGAVLKDMKPGGYVIKARDASTAGKVSNDDEDDEYGEGTQPAQARRWVIFTDMAMVAYDGSESLDVVVRSLKSAKVQAGVRVALVARNGEDLAEATSDGTGRVRFLRPLLEGDGAMKPKMVMAYGPQGDLAVLDLDRSPVDLSKQGMGGRTTPGAEDGDETGGRTVNSDIDGYLYADRGIYRPGEMVHLAALIRDVQSKAVKDRKGVIVVSRPSGVEFKRIAFDRAPGGVVTADLGLPKSAPRGRWRATLEIEGIKEPTGSLSFSVEDFAPQRLAVDTDGRAATPVAAGETRQISVLARFLYGASGAGLQTQGEARIMADTNPFPAYKDYQWGDQQTAFDEKFMELGTSVTDGDGKAVLSVSTADLPETTTPLKATVTASVFEPGGRPVRESLFLKVRTKPVYLGVKIEQGDGGSSDATPVTLDVIAVDSLGKRIAAPGSTYTLIAENWDYDWFQQDGRWQWRRTSRDVVVQKGALNIGAGGAARVARRLGWGDYRLVVEGPSGAKSVIRFAAGWGAPAKDAEAPDFVRISAGTGTHGQGDSVTLTIKAPYAGEAQVAVATDRVIDFKTFSVGQNGGSVTLKTNAAWGGGAYVLVSVIQPRDPKATPKPRRALGLLYVPLDPKGRKLNVELGTPVKLNSRAPVEVPVTVKGLGIGQRARVTVAAVDEGILRLTKFDSPDPVKWYFGKRALTLDYRDDYGRLLDANLGAPANVNFGSDQLGGEGLTVTPIKSVALWSGVVETGLDGKAKIKLPAAEFNGELRVMAVAWTDEAVGSASKAMTVREAVIADLNLPRFLAPGDKPFATLELHNVEGAAGGYTAETSSSGGVQMVFRKVFQLVLGQRIAERIPFLAPTVSGIGKVGFKVFGPNGFSTAKDYPIQTRLGWSPVTRTYTELQAAGAAYTPTPNMLAGLAAGDVSMTVSYSPFKGFDPGPIAASLSRYPYGCTEQVVSVAYPLLYAREMAPDPKKRSSSAGLNDAVGKLLDRQTLDGAFGLWRVGDGEADAWLGAYATDFLWEAKMRGAPVPDAAMERALGAMRQISRPDGWVNVSYRLEYPEWWGRTPDESKKATERMRSRASAYALYILAKSGRGDLARLRWWHDVHMKDDNSPMARAQIGAGLALMGDRARARSSFRKAVAAIGYRDDNDWYQSQLRDIAGVIALAYEADMPDVARELQKRLEGAVRDPDSLNTQEQARLLQAASFMLKAAGVQRIDATGVVALPTAGQTRWSVGRLADAKFVNRGGGALWRTVTVRGTTIASPGGESNGLTVGKRFFTMSGAGVDPMNLRQGDRVIVLVQGRSMQGRTVPLVIDDALPAGWEIETTLSPEDAKEGPFKFLGELTGVDVQEARDDRYISAVDLGGNQSFAVAYVARAVTPGEFFLPAPEVRDMYRPSVNARGDGARTTIAAGN